ncbi:hypothetical protein ACFE04_028282 [Oxalis oulophora]
MWMIRATTSILVWTCIVQLTTVGDLWGPRVLKGWPSCFESGGGLNAVTLDTVSSLPAVVLPPKSKDILVLLKCALPDLNVTLIVPELDKTSFWADPSALRFTSHIEELGRKVINLLRQNGPFLVLHLRYEMDMLAFSGCSQGCNHDEVEELTRMRHAYPWWKEKIINSDLKRKDGLCPLTSEETALILRALEIDRNIQIYIAAGEIFGGERRMASLAAAYPKLHDAACRVIARLKKERDESRTLLAQADRQIPISTSSVNTSTLSKVSVVANVAAMDKSSGAGFNRDFNNNDSSYGNNGFSDRGKPSEDGERGKLTTMTTPDIISSLKKYTEAPSSDAIKSFIPETSESVETQTPSGEVWIAIKVSVVVNLIELCLCTGEGRDASLATVQVYICFFSS